MGLKRIILACSMIISFSVQAVTTPISGGAESGILLSKDGKVYAWGGDEVTDFGSYSIPCRKHLALDTTVEGFEKKAFYTTPQLVDTKGIKFIQVDAGSGSLFTGISDKGILYYWGLNATRETIAKRDTIVTKTTSSTDSITKLDTIIKIQYVVPDSIINRPMPVKCAKGMAGYNEDGSSDGQYIGRVKKVSCSNSGFIAIMEDSTAILSHDFIKFDYVQTSKGEIIKNIVDIDACDFNYYAITKDGTLYTQKMPFSFQEDTTSILSPVLEEKTKEPLKNVVSVGAGDRCAFAVTKDGNAYGCGDGGWGGCTGTGMLTKTENAMPIVSGQYSVLNKKDYLDNIKQIEGGRGYGMAVTFDGYVLYWGNNDGNGGAPGILSNNEISVYSPVFLTYKNGIIVNDAVAIACGDNFGFVINKKNEIFAFGRNDMGQCGVGDSASTLVETSYGKINAVPYLYPMTLNFEPLMCPSIRLLEDTITSCQDGYAAISSQILEETDYTINWYYEGNQLAETTNTCNASKEGKYTIVVTPKDSLCPVSSDYTYFKLNDLLMKDINDTILVANIDDVKINKFSFMTSSTKDTRVVLYNDENCENVIDTINIKSGLDTICIHGVSLSSEDGNANVWAKEYRETRLHTALDSNAEYSSIINFMAFTTSSKDATLHSFKIKTRSMIPIDDPSITPVLYKVRKGENGYIFESTEKYVGEKHVFSNKNSQEIEHTIVCDFKLLANSTYVIGIDNQFYISAYTEQLPNNQLDINYLLKNPIKDNNDEGIVWIGNVMNGMNPTESVKFASCYSNSIYDLKFTNIVDLGCETVQLTNIVKIDDETTVKEIINDNPNDENRYDILGRKVKNVQPKNIYIQNGKKFIINNK